MMKIDSSGLPSVIQHLSFSHQAQVWRVKTFTGKLMNFDIESVGVEPAPNGPDEWDYQLANSILEDLILKGLSDYRCLSYVPINY